MESGSIFTTLLYKSRYFGYPALLVSIRMNAIVTAEMYTK